MLSRHFLRAKALQTIYAGVSNPPLSAEDLQKDTFDYNVLKLNDLGLLQLSTLGQLTFTAERILEGETQKFTPQKKEIDFLRKIAENRFVERLCSGMEYRRLMDKLKVDWSNNFDVFRKILNNIKTSKQYQDYNEIDDPSFNDDRTMAVNAFRFLMNDSTLRDIIFDRELLWEDDFDQVAQYVFMLLKECDESLDEASPCPQILNLHNDKDMTAYNFARQLVADTYSHIDDVEPMIRKHLQNWDFDRVALMDIILINMAVTEFVYCPSIPERVTVDEYIELSKEFSTEKSKLFINGILDKILIELRVAGRVVKNDRGMYDPEIDGDTPPEE